MMKKTNAKEYVDNLENTICYKDKFFVKQEVYELLDNIFEDRMIEIGENEKLYRSRIYNKDDKKEKEKKLKYNEVFEGYDEKESFINLNGIAQENRMNPRGVRYLYTSEDMFTSILEINPNYDDLISVAEIKILSPLRIVDLSKCCAGGDNYLSYISLNIQKRISEDNYDNYKFPQFIAQYCEIKGYDGVAYKSRYSNLNSVQICGSGRNFTIFNYEKCKAINSKLFNCCKRYISVKSIYDDNIVCNNE